MKTFKMFINESSNSYRINESVKKIKAIADVKSPPEREDYEDANGICMTLKNIKIGGHHIVKNSKGNDMVQVNMFYTEDGNETKRYHKPTMILEVGISKDYDIIMSFPADEWKKAAQTVRKKAPLCFSGKLYNDKKDGFYGISYITNIWDVAEDVNSADSEDVDVHWYFYSTQNEENGSIILDVKSPSGDCQIEFNEKQLNEFLNAIDKLK